MSRQPYIYTMPERFMEDESVPVKWRLYGYINGFWISGKPVYATNEHFAEKLKCSERHISRALADLEAEGLLMRNVHGFKRYILPGGMTPDVRGGRHGMSAQHDMGGQHISDSNSENKLGADARPLLTEEIIEYPDLLEESRDSKSPRVSGDKRKAYDELIAWSEKERGFKFPPTFRTKQYKAFKLANQNGITRAQLMERWEEMATEKFWQKNGYDWMNVFDSFSKKV